MYREGLDYDLTLESLVLYAIVDSGRPGELGAALEVVPAEDWYLPRHERLVRWLAEYERRARPVNVVDVSVELARTSDGAHLWRGEMARALAGGGGPDALPSVASLQHYLVTRAGMAQRRRSVASLERALLSVRGAEVSEVGARVSEAAALVREGFTARQSDAGEYGWDDWLCDVQEDSVSGSRLRCGFGLPSLDTMGAGNPGDLVIIAARPATGKTALALQATVHNAAAGRRVALANYEMTAKQQYSRMAATYSGVNSRKITDAPQTLTPRDWDALLEASEYLRALPLTVVEGGRRTAEDLDRWVVALGDVALLIVDHVQIVPPLARRASRERQIGETCTRLKQLAVERGCVVMRLAQLNRMSVQGTPRAPQLGDLRDSGQLEQDADRVVMGWVPDDESSARQWLVRKNRHGPVGGVLLPFEMPRQRFGRDLDDVEV